MFMPAGSYKMSVLAQLFGGLSQIIGIAVGMLAWPLASIVNVKHILCSTIDVPWWFMVD